MKRKSSMIWCTTSPCTQWVCSRIILFWTTSTNFSKGRTQLRSNKREWVDCVRFTISIRRFFQITYRSYQSRRIICSRTYSVNKELLMSVSRSSQERKRQRMARLKSLRTRTFSTASLWKVCWELMEQIQVLEIAREKWMSVKVWTLIITMHRLLPFSKEELYLNLRLVKAIKSPRWWKSFSFVIQMQTFAWTHALAMCLKMNTTSCSWRQIQIKVCVLWSL